MNWITIKLSELSDAEPVRRDGKHSFISPKRITWLRYCKYCGHVACNNHISSLVTKIGCSYENDVRFRAWRKR